ncbi:MAG: NADH-quinone oxidoreductase subunit M, partial [Methylocystis sp.]|nr:NADH-quinone oxidoreductase subunit M [Methylocystis sp.]
MFGFGILSGVTFLPLVGVAFLLTQKGDDEASLRNIRWATLATTLATFALSLVIWSGFD